MAYPNYFVTDCITLAYPAGCIKLLNIGLPCWVYGVVKHCLRLFNKINIKKVLALSLLSDNSGCPMHTPTAPKPPKIQKIFGIDNNAKTRKGIGFRYSTAIIYLSPSKKICASSSEGCLAACLNTAGRGRMAPVQEARQKKTLRFLSDREAFVKQMEGEIVTFVKGSKKKNLIPCIRPNGTSDVAWHTFGVMEKFPHIQFYDYTPNFGRMLKFLKGELPTNYHLTFSRKENNEAQCDLILSMGGNVAMVFNKVPETYKGYRVINGDESDLRFLDEKNVIVGLKAKGEGKKDKSGFVIHI